MKCFLSALAGFGLLAVAAPAYAGLLYTFDGAADTLEVIDTTTFERTTVGPAGFDVGAVDFAYDPNSDRLFAVNAGFDSSELYSVDRDTGAASLIASLDIRLLSGLTFDSLNNVLYGANNGLGGSALLTLDTVTGIPTTVATLAGPIDSLVYDSVNDRLIGHDIPSDLFEIDRTTGLLSQLNNTGDLFGVFLAYDPDRDLFWTFNGDGRLATADPNTGFLQTIQSSEQFNSPSGLVFVPTAVTPIPEPSSLAALGIGLLTIGVFARRRRKV